MVNDKEYMKEWRKQNSDKIKEYQQEYYKKNAEDQKQYKKEYYIKNRELLKEKRRQYYLLNKKQEKETMREYYNRIKSSPEILMLRAAKNRAKKAGLIFSLEASDIMIPKICPVLGIPLLKNTKFSGDNSMSIDRIDNTKGYVKGNIIVVSHRANRLKSDATAEELRRIADFYGKC